MSLVTVIVTLLVVGVVLSLINSLIPMDGKIKAILNLLIIILVVIWLLKVFHITHLPIGLKITS